ncbi:MAG TPA: thiamine pyrophosphate-binding protein, partial [Burkholderiales bacterium]|nr:thiamine pyrophosphate-binding protein [Burkholderiales bacterium]
MTIHATHLVGKALRRQGADTMFFLMGGPMFTTESGCVAEGLRAIDVRHEQAAAMMAHGYARMLTRPGVCMAASGPAALNFGTGLATSLVDCTPVIALGGSSTVRELGLGAFQEFDQVAALRPVTKWAERVYEARRIPELIHKAFAMAMSGKPGPVYLDLPADVLHQQIDESTVVWPEYGRGTQIGRPTGDPAMVEAAIALLARAKRPIVLSGSGASWSGAATALQAFVDATGIPFYTTPQGRGVIPESHKYCYLTARNLAFKEADVVLVVGTRINWIVAHMHAPRFNAQAKFIRIDIDPAEIAATARLDVGLVGDAKRIVEQLNAANDRRVRPELFEAWRRHLAAAHEERHLTQEIKLNTEQLPIHPLRLCKEIRDFMDREAVLVVDGQEILNYGRQTIPTYLPGHRLNSGTFGTMGVGLPYALGAKAACPDREVICLHGDGSFGINGMELDTAVRHRLPVITVISLNAGWMSDPSHQWVGRDLGFTRYDRMAEG